jgi:hypothetical protein
VVSSWMGMHIASRLSKPWLLDSTSGTGPVVRVLAVLAHPA